MVIRVVEFSEPPLHVGDKQVNHGRFGVRPSHSRKIDCLGAAGLKQDAEFTFDLDGRSQTLPWARGGPLPRVTDKASCCVEVALSPRALPWYLSSCLLDLHDR